MDSYAGTVPGGQHRSGTACFLARVSGDGAWITLTRVESRERVWVSCEA